MAIIDELVTILSFDADTKGGEQFERSLSGIKKTALAAGTALVGLTATVGAFVGRMSAEISETDKFSRSLGISADTLQGLEFAIERAGGSVGDLRGDLKNLAQTLSSPVPGEYNQGLFNLGVQAFDAAGNLRGADEVLIDIADSLEKYGPRQRQILAAQLGLSEGTLRLLSKGRKEILSEIERARGTGLILDERDLKLASEYNKQVKLISSTLKGIWKQAAISLLEVRVGIAESIGEFLVKNKDIIALRLSEVFSGIARAIRATGAAIKNAAEFVWNNMSPAFKEMVKDIDVADISFKAFFVTIGAIVAILSPFLAKIILVGAGLKLASSAFEDFMKFTRGEDSKTGEFLDMLSEKFPGIKEKIRDSTSAAKEFASSLSFEGMADQDNFLEKFPRFQKVVESAGDNIPKIFSNIFSAISEAENFGDLKDSFLNLVSTIIDSIPIILDSLGRLSEKIKPGLTLAVDFLLAALSRLFDFIATGVRLYTGQFEALSMLLTGDFIGAINKSSEAVDRFGRDIIDIFGKIFGADDLSGILDSNKIIEEISNVGVSVNTLAQKIFNAVIQNVALAGKQMTESVGKVAKDLIMSVPGASFLLGEEEESDEQKIARFKAMRRAGEILSGGISPASPFTVPQAVAAGGQTNNYRTGAQVSQTNNFNISGASDPAGIVSRIASRRDDGLNRALQIAAVGAID